VELYKGRGAWQGPAKTDKATPERAQEGDHA
jgi:hypothetical protein